jgi:hypothetical protein
VVVEPRIVITEGSEAAVNDAVRDALVLTGVEAAKSLSLSPDLIEVTYDHGEVSARVLQP